MEIQSLRLLITQHDVELGVPRLLADNPQIKKIQVRLASDGIHITGVYHMVFDVAFEASWELSVQEGKLAVHLAKFQVVGMGGGLLKPVLLSAIADAVKKQDGIQLDGDTILVDVDRWLLQRGLALRTNLRAVEMGAGTVLIKSSTTV
jgi:hypothetical protein